MGNFSLDDFGGDEAAPGSVDADAEPESTDADAVEIGSADDEPDIDTLATYRWTPDATACPRCGTAVQKRWLDGDEYVCLDCKSW